MSAAKAQIGLIGCGGIAATHLPNVLGCGRLHLRAAADLDRGRLEQFAAQAGCDYLTTDVERIFGDKQIDGVMVCTSNDTHTALVLGALEAGKHVFVEKPLALSSADCRRIVAASERTGKGVMVGYWYGLHPAFTVLRERIPQPYILTARCAAGASGSAFDAAAAFSSQMRPVSGFAAGGSLLHQGCYLLWIAGWLADSRPSVVYAMAPVNDVYQNALVSIRYESGAVAGILNSAIGGGGVLQGKWFYEVLGGRVNGAIENLTRLVFTGQVTETLQFGYHEGFTKQPEHFAAMILDGATPPVDGRSAAGVNLLAEAIYESIRTGKPVTAGQMPLWM